MLTDVDKKMQKNAIRFICSFCDYNSSNKYNYEKHILTPKHLKNCTLLTNVDTNVDKKVEKNAEKKYECECGKKYNHRQSLSLHKKTNGCGSDKPALEEKSESKIVDKQDNDLVLILLKENQEFKQMLLEQNKQLIELTNKSNGTTINNNNCTNNNHFNLNLFLNEHCKDAMNIMDFVNSLKLTLQDLEKTAELGYVKGITNIIVNGLNQLDVHKRPIHCSDIKRETLYVKDNNSWEKENEDKTKITRAIKHISIRNAKQIGDWTKENNGYNDSSNKKSDKYLKMVIEANGGEPEEINKIISNVSSKVTIDKQVT
jgi:uncharacterized protein YxeA